MKHANENLPVPLEISDEALDQLLANAQVTAAEPFRKKRMKRDVSRLIKRTRTIRFGMDLRLAYSAVGVIAVGSLMLVYAFFDPTPVHPPLAKTEPVNSTIAETSTLPREIISHVVWHPMQRPQPMTNALKKRIELLVASRHMK